MLVCNFTSVLIFSPFDQSFFIRILTNLYQITLPWDSAWWKNWYFQANKQSSVLEVTFCTKLHSLCHHLKLMIKFSIQKREEVYVIVLDPVWSHWTTRSTMKSHFPSRKTITATITASASQVCCHQVHNLLTFPPTPQLLGLLTLLMVWFISSSFIWTSIDLVQRYTTTFMVITIIFLFCFMCELKKTLIVLSSHFVT